MVGPFIFVDQFGPARLDRARAWTSARTRTSTSPPSPICSTARSSIATASARAQVIEPGAINLMTAGRGIVHSRALARRESAPTGRASTACRPGSRCPTARRRSTRRSSMSPATACRWSRARASSARVLMGTLWGKTAGVTCASPDHLCRHHARRRRERPDRRRADERAVMLVEGEASLDGEPLELVHALRPRPRPADDASRPTSAARAHAAGRRGLRHAAPRLLELRRPRRAIGSTRPRRIGRPAASRWSPATRRSSSRSPKSRKTVSYP